MADPSEADLALAKAAVGTLLEGLGLSAHLYAVEPREGKWAVIVECATGSGWQRVELRAGPGRSGQVCAPNGRRIWTTASTTDAAPLRAAPRDGPP